MTQYCTALQPIIVFEMVFELLGILWKLCSQIITGVRIVSLYELIHRLRYGQLQKKI